MFVFVDDVGGNFAIDNLSEDGQTQSSRNPVVGDDALSRPGGETGYWSKISSWSGKTPAVRQCRVESDALTPGGRIRWRERGRALSRGFLRGLSPATGHPDNSRQLICLPFRGPTEKGNNGPGVFAHRAS